MKPSFFVMVTTYKEPQMTVVFLHVPQSQGRQTFLYGLLLVGSDSRVLLGRLLSSLGVLRLALLNFLWLFPQPDYSQFNTLEAVDAVFTDSVGKVNFLNHLISIVIRVLCIQLTFT